MVLGSEICLAGTLSQQICPCLHKYSLVNYLKEPNNSPEKGQRAVNEAHLHIFIPRSVLMCLGHNKSWSFIPLCSSANSHHRQCEFPSFLKDEGIKGEKKKKRHYGEGNTKVVLLKKCLAAHFTGTGGCRRLHFEETERMQWRELDSVRALMEEAGSPCHSSSFQWWMERLTVCIS